MRVLVAVFVLLAAAGGAFAYIQSEPDWYVRLRYPLEYDHIVTGHAKNYDLDPALLAAVIYRESKFDAQREVVVGRARPDAASPGHGQGDCVAHGR